MTALRILVVEDNAIIAMLLAEMLVSMGYEVCATEDTEVGAVSAAICHRPDLMIVDARLREGSGISAIDQILRVGFIPYLLVSGDVLARHEIGPRAIVLRKPYDEPGLVRAIQRALIPLGIAEPAFRI
jgi:CheY-like chemotaxis protein